MADMSDASDVEKLTAPLDATGLSTLMTLATLLLALHRRPWKAVTAALAPSSRTAH